MPIRNACFDNCFLGICGQDCKGRIEKKSGPDNLEQFNTLAFFEIYFFQCVRSTGQRNRAGGRRAEVASQDGSVCSKQPKILLKIFPLRACSLLNVVIIQNVCLPLFPVPSNMCLLQTSTASVETVRSLEAALHSCVCTASSGPVDRQPACSSLDIH